LIIDNDISKSHRKSESLIQNIDISKSLFNKEKYKTHHRQSSMEVKIDKIKSKNISSMKEMIGNNNLKNKSNNKNDFSNIILNQGIPCFNNINIYTTNKNDVNLRQYIFNKVGKQKVNKISHVRSISNNFY
jgi:hypothetical protein